MMQSCCAGGEKNLARERESNTVDREEKKVQARFRRGLPQASAVNSLGFRGVEAPDQARWLLNESCAAA